MKRLAVLTCLVLVSSLIIACGEANKPIEKKTVVQKPIENMVKEPVKPKKSDLDYLYDAFEYIMRHAELRDYYIDFSDNTQREALKLMKPILSEKERYRFEKSITEEYSSILFDLKSKIEDERDKLPSYNDYRRKHIETFNNALNMFNEKEKKNKVVTFNDCTDILVYLLKRGEELDTVFDNYGLYALRSNPKEFKFSLDDSLEFWKELK